MEKIKIEVRRKERTLDLSDLKGSFEDVINVFNGWKEYYESRCEDGECCKLEYDYYGYGGTSELYVKYYREETDKEFTARLQIEQKHLIEQQQKDLKQLKKLQEKYKELDIEL